MAFYNRQASQSEFHRGRSVRCCLSPSILTNLVHRFVQGAEEDVDMADAPDEYLDPITYTIMQDPVKLPSGAVMDRPNVMRMLLTDPRDPTTRFAISNQTMVKRSLVSCICKINTLVCCEQ